MIHTVKMFQIEHLKYRGIKLLWSNKKSTIPGLCLKKNSLWNVGVIRQYDYIYEPKFGKIIFNVQKIP